VETVLWTQKLGPGFLRDRAKLFRACGMELTAATAPRL